MDATLVKLPEEQNCCSKTISIASAAFATGRLDGESAPPFDKADSAASQPAGLEHDMDIAFRENPARDVRTGSGDRFARRQKAVSAFLTGGRDPSPAWRSRFSAGGLQTQGEQALAESYRFWDKGMDQLDVLLNARIGGFQERKRTL